MKKEAEERKQAKLQAKNDAWVKEQKDMAEMKKMDELTKPETVDVKPPKVEKEMKAVKEDKVKAVKEEKVKEVKEEKVKAVKEDKK